MPPRPFRYSPFSQQQLRLMSWWDPAISPVADKDMVIAEGSIRSGKTIAMLDGFTEWSLKTFEDQDFIIASKSAGALERNIIKPWLKILVAKGLPYQQHRGDVRSIQVGTNTYYCFGAPNESSQDVVQGMTSAGALLDDVALFPQSFVEQVKGRCSLDDAKVWCNCNPEGPFHWLKTDYIDKAKELGILSLHFDMNDNLSLSDKVKDRYKRMFTGVWYKRMILGMWVMAEGAIYDMFDEGRHVFDGRIPEYANYFISFDYGTGAPCTWGLYGYNTPKSVDLLREYYWDSSKEGRQKTDSQYGDDFTNWVKEGRVYKFRGIYGDPSAASFIAELKNRGYSVIPANNDVIDGIRFVGSLLSQDQFRIHKSCTKAIEGYQSYVWDPNAQKKGEDKPLKQNDHTVDRDRYGLYTHFGAPGFMAGKDVSR
ncbi:MAG: PBSX family phage terminase large subunit [Syntrophobacteraceae bacterium]